MRSFICKDCGKGPNCPMLKDEVWGRIGGVKVLLCIKCAETRLKRRITLKDLQPCYGNDWGVIIAKRAFPKLDITDYEAWERIMRALS
jgi:hypothetical protein